MIIKIIILGFIFFVVWRTFGRLKNNDISRREFLVWLVFWLGVGLAALWPQKTDVIAAWLGVSRGADLLVYLSILAIFFLVFKLVVRQEKLDRQITELVRRQALDEKNKLEKNG